MPKALILETPVWLISGILLVSDPMRMLQPDGIIYRTFSTTLQSFGLILGLYQLTFTYFSLFLFLVPC